MTIQNKLKEKILSFMESNQSPTYDMNDLSTGLNTTAAEEFRDLVKAIAELEREHQIVLDDQGRFSLPKDSSFIEGVFQSSARGFGFVRVEEMEEDIFIPPNKTLYALNNDRVRVEITKKAEPWNKKGPEGAVLEVIERGTTNVVGLFTAYSPEEVLESPYYGYVEPQDKKLEGMTIFIAKNGIKPIDQAIVQVEIVYYPNDKFTRSMVGLVTREVGHKNEPGVDILAVVYKHGIPTEFSPETLAELDRIPNEVLPAEREGRLDLRNVPTITIDGADAKDLDDAISIEVLDNGNYYLGVHIADVSHYVRQGSAIDEDAFERGTSSYLTDRVIPMLPPKLSNGICSINPGVERLTLSALMEVNSHGDVVDFKVTPSVIISNERTTYDEINEFYNGSEEIAEKYSEYTEMFNVMRELHEILEEKRRRRGAINFDTKEAQIVVDDEGTPLEIVLRERGISERLIESFMLIANESVSEYFTKRNLPILYRVHERPDQAKMQSFIEFVSRLGIQVKATSDTISPKHLQRILNRVEGEDEESVVTMTLLRSMQQARYDIEHLGHFGLAAEFYSHFTAPIRRYPDLMLHRLIHEYDEGNTSVTDKSRWNALLPDVAEHSSMAERRAVDAEREVDEMKKVEFMADKVGHEFDAIIVSVLGFGIFVQLENTVEGLIHISNMKQDYFEYHEDALMLVGKRTGVSYRIGQHVRVKLTSANTDTHELDFELVLSEEELEKVKENQDKQTGNRHNRRRNSSNNRPNKKEKSQNQGKPSNRKKKRNSFKITKKK